jgi:hypothetical protein
VQGSVAAQCDRTEFDPDYWARDEEHRRALVAAGEEHDYEVADSRVLLLHKVSTVDYMEMDIFKHDLKVMFETVKREEAMESHLEKHGELAGMC